MIGSDKQQLAFRMFLVFLVAGIVAALVKNPWFTLLIMASAVVQNLTYSMASRSGVRNSYVYYALTSPLASVAFYMTLRFLVSKDMTLWFFAPYVAATVFGSVSGSNISKRVEKKFNITTRTDEKEEKALKDKKKTSGLSEVETKRLAWILKEKEKTSGKGRWVLAFVLCGIAVLLLRSGAAAIESQLLLIGLVALKEMSFTLVRSSRNTNKPWFHAVVTVLDGVLWYFMWRELVMAKLPLALIPPYMLGGILGGLCGQKVAFFVGKRIQAEADAHLKGKSPSIVGPALCMLLLGFVSTVWLGEWRGPMFMFAVAAFQSVSFSLVSRSRNRNNTNYHAIASVFSNGAWYLVFRNVVRKDMQLAYAPAYIAGSVFGSLIGVGASMYIEKMLGAASDDHVQAKK